MKLKNKYKLGEIVAFKSHPLLYSYYIKGDGKLVPPFMVVTEIIFENKMKKLVDETTGKKIAERVKYHCTFFDDNKNQFKNVVVYESMLENYKSIYIARNGKNDNKQSYESLIEEASKYTIPNYNYAKIIYFKTKKFEIFKKRTSERVTRQKKNGKEKETKKQLIQYVVNYATPDFVLTGLKAQEIENAFYANGERRRIASKLLYKVKWFNSSQMKFSEQFLPSECFMSEQPFDTIISHSEEE